MSVAAILCGMVLASGPAIATPPPDATQMRQWIQAMREAPRGPFQRLRWFCADGTVLPPEPYACAEHGGGRQHGQWSARTRRIREAGYPIATVFAALPPDHFMDGHGGDQELARVLVEQFLIAADDGWIMHRARHYRGALQAETEARGAQRLLAAIATEPDWLTRRYLLLREAARLFPLDDPASTIQDIRTRASSIARDDPGFATLRNKIHVLPDGDDAQRVRDYAASVSTSGLKERLEALASAIDEVYDPQRTVAMLAPRLRQLPGPGGSADGQLDALADADAVERLRVTSRLLRRLREVLPDLARANDRVAALRVSVALERMAFAAAGEVRQAIPEQTRRQRLAGLEMVLDAAYGSGLLTDRERRAQARALAGLDAPTTSLGHYRAALDYLARVPRWALHRLEFHFGPAVEHMAGLEPLARDFVPDRIRGSLLLLYAELLSSLQADANRLAGITHRLFGTTVHHGVRRLNPGFATGVLRTEADLERDDPPAGIYVLPETVSALPPVDGIITAGEGNPVSHVQLLAGDLGIPNVVVADEHLSALRARRGEEVMLAVSPRGVVHLSVLPTSSDDSERALAMAQAVSVWEAKRKRSHQPTDGDGRAPVSGARDPIPLEELGTEDAGYRVGPKAAELAELHRRFPARVAPAIALPFGAFQAVLERPIEPGGPKVADWLARQREALRALDGVARARRQAAMLARLRDWIRTQRPGPVLRERLRETMRVHFGQEGGYGVFVRSDTNVEDLPGFTGAGLNQTVPHVVGFDAIMAAISEVWASPFTARAYGWRRNVIDPDTPVLPSVLLQRSVPADKSGVLITADVSGGRPGMLSIAVNEGVGGVVDGQRAETLRVDSATGNVRLLASATAPYRRELAADGGLREVPASGAARVLEPAEIEKLVEFARVLPERYPAFFQGPSSARAVDVEFGFVDGELMLFQLRPWQRDPRNATHPYLRRLDAPLQASAGRTVALRSVPPGGEGG